MTIGMIFKFTVCWYIANILTIPKIKIDITKIKSIDNILSLIPSDDCIDRGCNIKQGLQLDYFHFFLIHVSQELFNNFFAIGAAALPPEPPCSTKTLIAYCGFLYGANATNNAWSLSL